MSLPEGFSTTRARNWHGVCGDAAHGGSAGTCPLVNSIYVATTGPWDRWTVLSVEPAGIFAPDTSGGGWHIVSPLQIAPLDTGEVQVHVRAEEASQEQLRFAVREAQPT